jgi:predicted peptidase
MKRFAPTMMLGILFLQATVSVAVEPVPGKQVEQTFKAKDGGEVPYLLYLPKNFEPGKPNPLMFFLHGRGESNGPLSVVAKWGPPLLVERGEAMPYIIVSPQCPKEDNWASATQQTRLSELLDMVVEKYSADKDRIYLTGLSMGGAGSWRLATAHPKRFAAVVPICGRGDVKDAPTLKDIPIWVFVGDQDGVFKDNVALTEAIRQAGSKSIRLTTLENVGHNSWSAAYATPDLYSWLDKQSASGR